MRADLIYTYTNEMSYNDWLLFRHINGFGASEIGGVLGLSDYTSPIQIFYDKISDKPLGNSENMAMFMGTEMESFVAKMHQYFDGSESGMIENYRNGKIIKKNQRVNAYIQNPKFKHLFVSLDRKINKINVGGSLEEMVLEIKTMSGFVKQKWEYGIPPAYISQVQQQLLVTDLKFGELAVLIDGRKFNVYEFERNDDFCEHILNRSTLLWNKILRGRAIKTQIYEAESNFNQRLVNELKQELISLEPDVNDTISVSDFLKEKYKQGTAGTRTGTPEELTLAVEHKKLYNQRKEIEQKMRGCENKIKNSMKEIQCLDFSDNGRVYWSNTKNSRMFRNKIKVND